MVKKRLISAAIVMMCTVAWGQTTLGQQAYTTPPGASVTAFGIKGDGTDETKQIQDALNSLSKLRDSGHGAASLYFPWGSNYGISSQIIIPDGVKMICPGHSFDTPGTMALFRPLANNITMFRTAADSRNNSIEGCGFQGNGKSGIVFTYWDTCVQCSLEHNVFREFDETSTAIKGGGSLYFDSGFNLFSGRGMSYDLQNEYSSVASKTYYGCGVCSFHDDVISAGHGARLYGNAILWHHQDMELVVSADSGGNGVAAALNLCDKTGTGPIVIDGESYFELTEDSRSVPRGIMAGIRACPTVLSVQDTQIYGSGTGTAIKFDSYMYSFRATGIEFARWNMGIDTGTGFTASGSPDTIISGNYWVNVATKVSNSALLNQKSQTTNLGSTHASGTFSLPDFGYLFSHAIVPASVRVAVTSAEAVLDLSLGNLFELGINGTARITGVAGNVGRGNMFILESECQTCVTLANNSTFHLSAGRDVVLPKNLPIWFVTVDNGQAYEVGNATRNLPTTASSLPRCGPALEGAATPVVDSATDVWGARISGGGSSHVRAYCDGSAWTVSGK